MSILDADRNSIIELYIAYFNRVPEADGLAYWINQFNQGMSLTKISNAFYDAAIQFSNQTGYSSMMTSSDFVKTLYANVLGRLGVTAPSASDVLYWSQQLDKKTLDRAGLVQKMLSDAKGFATDPTYGYVAKNLQQKLDAGIDHAVVLGINYNTLDEAVVRGKQYLSDYVEWSKLTTASTQITGKWYQIGSTLYGNSTPSGQVVVNLSQDKITDNSITATLSKGSPYYAINVDLSLLALPTTPATAPAYNVMVTGDDQANIIVGSNLGDQIKAGKGEDTISLGSGTDRVVLEGDALVNGIDEIYNFVLGTDILDVSAFLNATQETPNLVEAAYDNTKSRDWQNGDILVLQGNNLTTATAIAQQFGSNKAYINPKTSAKALVITADVTGDARLWYLANQTGLATITANEIVQVATLHDINNLLTQDTLTSLAASMASYKPAGILSFDKKSVIESVSNNGMITDKIRITLTGDNFSGNVNGLLGTISNAPTNFVVKLVKVSDTEADLVFVGRAQAHSFTDSINNLTITFTSADFQSGSLPVIDYFDDIAVNFFDIYAEQVGNVLTVKNTVASSALIDLASDQVFFGGKKSGIFGNLQQVTTVDLRDVVGPGPVSLTVVGDVVNEVIFASNTVDGTYVGGAGNDAIHLSTTAAFQDTIYFYTVDNPDPTKNNGTDIVTGFKVGGTATTNDRLDFTQFLSKPNKGNIATVDAIASAGSLSAWANGDILVVQGDFVNNAGVSIINAQMVASLFGNVFAAPTNQANAVVIAADILGDATIWAVSNHGDGTASGLTSVAQDEVYQLATLVGVNNLILTPFAISNFV